MEGEKKKILVVDDEENYIKAYKRLFRQTEYEIFTAMSGIEAINSVHTNHPDLVILDVNMPGGGGDDVYDLLRMSQSTERIPVIFVSGEDLAALRNNFTFINQDNYMPKPFDSEELIEKVNGLLRN